VTTLHVACAAEGEYVAHSAAMLHSVLANADGLDVRVHYLHGPRLPAGEREALAAMVEREGGAIDFPLVDDERVAALPSDSRFTAAMWHRFFLPELAPGADRALYLDVDTLVVDALAPLWATALDGHLLGAVTNVFQENHRFRPAELGLAGRHVYFNSGVLLMDLAAMRREGTTGALLDCVAERGAELEWPDQDALNIVLGERRLELHPRWNATNALALPGAREAYGRRGRRAARRSPGIRHFEGPGENKPWHPDCPFPQAKLYWKHREAAGF
jgi:lipopolysaccharide biosynthesis glycosyltransferase